jgi:hypothetical protein
MEDLNISGYLDGEKLSDKVTRELFRLRSENTRIKAGWDAVDVANRNLNNMLRDEKAKTVNLTNMLEDVVNSLNLSAEMVEKHGPLGTPPAELVTLVLERLTQENSP